MKRALGCEVVGIFNTSILSVVVLHEVHQVKDELCFMEQQRMEVTHAHLFLE